VSSTNPHQDAAYWESVEEAAELIQEEQFQEALYSLRDVVLDEPSNPYAYYLMGVSLVELSRLEPARDAYRAAINLSPKYIGARVSLCHVLRMLGEHREAIREGERALEICSDDGDLIHALGLAHAARGDRKASLRYLEAYLKTDPEFEVATEVRQMIELLKKNEGPLEFV
jgi:tetratricopeptide (TPR) repeat protein